MVDRQDRGHAFGAATLLLANGVVHVIAFPDHYKVAPYIGVLFLLLALATAALTVGVAMRIRFAWSTAALLSAGSIVLYVVARTSGLPYYREDSWLDMMGAIPLGLVSLILEGSFLVLYLKWRPDSNRFRYGRPAF